MKLSKLYCNLPETFKAVHFNPGFNVVFAKFYDDKNRKKTNHNLGKSLFYEVIDYCLLKQKKGKNIFLLNSPRFKNIVFYLEIKLTDGTYLTIRRFVDPNTNIAFVHHSEQFQDQTKLDDSLWDHTKVAISRAVSLLDSYLKIDFIKPDGYRKNLSFHSRSQSEYSSIQQIFQPASYNRAADKDWKPHMMRLMNLDAENLSNFYDANEKLSEKEGEIKSLKARLASKDTSFVEIEGKISIIQDEVNAKISALEKFDFHHLIDSKTTEAVSLVSEKIQYLDSQQYYLRKNKRRIENTLNDDETKFDSSQVIKLFKEAGVVFDGQIVKDFDQLVEFNKLVTSERRGYLQEDLDEISTQLAKIQSELRAHNTQKSELLSFLNNTDPFDQYKMISDEIVTLKTRLSNFESMRESLQEISDTQDEIDELEKNKSNYTSYVDTDLKIASKADSESTFAHIRKRFNNFFNNVLFKQVNIVVQPNKKGNIEFDAKVLSDVEEETEQGNGSTYNRIMCIAFDLALLSVHTDKHYINFLYHDGALEGINARTKDELIKEIRAYCELYDIQYIATMIDADVFGLPSASIDGDIILTLHDRGDAGQLFNMPPW